MFNVAKAQLLVKERWRLRAGRDIKESTMTSASNNGQCPKCQSESIYQDRDLWVCAECAHEWMAGEQAASSQEMAAEDLAVRDSNGTVLNDGDSVIVIKDLKIKGSSSSVKSGTKVRGIRLSDGGDGHNIACKIDGIGSINLKSEFVRKA